MHPKGVMERTLSRCNIIAIPEGIWKIATEQWDSSIAQNLHVEGAYTGNGAHPFSGLSTLNIYSPHEFHIRATDTEDKHLNMLAAVKDDAALVLGPKFKIKFETTSADNWLKTLPHYPTTYRDYPQIQMGTKALVKSIR